MFPLASFREVHRSLRAVLETVDTGSSKDARTTLPQLASSTRELLRRAGALRRELRIAVGAAVRNSVATSPQPPPSPPGGGGRPVSASPRRRLQRPASAPASQAFAPSPPPSPFGRTSPGRRPSLATPLKQQSSLHRPPRSPSGARRRRGSSLELLPPGEQPFGDDGELDDVYNWESPVPSPSPGRRQRRSVESHPWDQMAASPSGSAAVADPIVEEEAAAALAEAEERRKMTRAVHFDVMDSFDQIMDPLSGVDEARYFACCAFAMAPLLNCSAS